MVLRSIAVCIMVCLCLSAQTLDQRVKGKISGFPGKVSLYAKNLQTGQTYALAAAEPVRTASTIKLPIMAECFFEASEGKLTWEEALRVTAEEKVSGTSVITEL